MVLSKFSEQATCLYYIYAMIFTCTYGDNTDSEFSKNLDLFVSITIYQNHWGENYFP